MALRRNIRLRKEYLARRAEQMKNEAINQKKRKINTYLTNSTPLPGVLRQDEKELRKNMSYDDSYTINKDILDVDDEYSNAGTKNPKVCLTTSHSPSSRLKQFSKELRLLFPNAVRLNRGGTKLTEMVQTCIKNNFSDLLIVHETRGEPDALTVCHLPHGPTATFTLYNTVMRHDLEADEKRKTISEVYPHLIFDNFTTKLGFRVEKILKHLFPVVEETNNKKESKRIMSFLNRDDFISLRHHTFGKKEGVVNFEIGKRKVEDIELEEIGPRFELQLYKIVLGTIDQSEAEVEWVRHHYVNSSKKRNQLANE
eukprot:snap_masked-scaffold_25-processed-gene-2.29-mRNA-1 protein AED:0.02 eAED:0.02 QI:0/-1/0/1/-1/1/1/0/311